MTTSSASLAYDRARSASLAGATALSREQQSALPPRQLYIPSTRPPLDLQVKHTEVELNLKEVWRAIRSCVDGTKQRQRNMLTGLLSKGLRPALLHIFVSLASVASALYMRHQASMGLW